MTQRMQTNGAPRMRDHHLTHEHCENYCEGLATLNYQGCAHNLQGWSVMAQKKMLTHGFGDPPGYDRQMSQELGGY